MPKESADQLTKQLISAIPHANAETLREILDKLPPQGSAEAFEDLDPESQKRVLNTLTADDLEPLLPHMPAQLADIVLQHYPQTDQRDALEEMWDDELADFLQEVPQENRSRYIDLLDGDTKVAAEELLKYPEESAGGRMTKAFATVHVDMTLQEAIDSLEEQKEDTEILARIYVVDDLNHMVGKIRLRDLTFNSHHTKVRDVLQPETVAINAMADQEEAANMMLKYDMITLPVVDESMALIGVITHDDAMEIMQEESTEDLERQSGIAGQQEEADYLETSVFSHFRRRFVWVLALALLAIVSGYVIYSFESMLDAWFMLALYMPMVVASGGNTGAQAATTVIRAMSLGEFEPGEFIHAIWKELRIGLMIGLMLGLSVAVLTPLVVHFIPGGSGPGLNSATLALIVACALTAQVTTSTFLGAALPILARALNQDPAVVASPAITTIVDVTGLILYFSLARLIIGI